MHIGFTLSEPEVATWVNQRRGNHTESSSSSSIRRIADITVAHCTLNTFLQLFTHFLSRAEGNISAFVSPGVLSVSEVLASQKLFVSVSYSEVRVSSPPLWNQEQMAPDRGPTPRLSRTANSVPAETSCVGSPRRI